MTERVHIQLTFEGAGLAEGRMDVDDAVHVLSGFAGAYSRIARSVNPDLEHRVTLTGIDRGSIEFLLEALAENPEAIAAALEAARVDAAATTIKTIFDLIKLKLHLRGGPPTVRPTENHLEFENSDGATAQFSKVVNNFYNNGPVHFHLNTLTMPLEKDGIDAAEFRATPEHGEPFTQRVDAEDRVFLTQQTETFTERFEPALVVRFTSLNKKTNKGRLDAGNNKGVSYVYEGDHPSQLHATFGTYHKDISARCKVRERRDSTIVHVTIYDFEQIQRPMFGTGNNA